MVTVNKIDQNTYSVSVAEGGSTTQHRVSVRSEYAKKLIVESESIEDLIRRSFEFLLERESKESILSSFDLKVISRYFPEYERVIKSKR